MIITQMVALAIIDRQVQPRVIAAQVGGHASGDARLPYRYSAVVRAGDTTAVRATAQESLPIHSMTLAAEIRQLSRRHVALPESFS